MAILYIVAASLISMWPISYCLIDELPQFVSISQAKTVKLLFVGDVMAHSPQIAKAQRNDSYDFKPCFRYVKTDFNSADIVVANLETTLSSTPPYGGYPLFKTPEALAQALADAGVDVVTMANNHALDMGSTGVEQTLQILSKYNIAATGVFKDSVDYVKRNPLRVERNGINFAILAYTYGTNGIPPRGTVKVNMLDTLQMSKDLRLCQDADCIIALLHWGYEYAPRPCREQRQIADFLHRAGCQVVIGSHPHVVQTANCSKTAVTVYSLGNFISNQRGRYCDGGIMAQVEVSKDSVGCQFNLDIQPVWVRQRDYAIIPKNVGDTIAMSVDERNAYLTFMRDTKKIFTSRF